MTFCGSVPSFALALSATKVTKASPYWSEMNLTAEDVLQVFILEHRGCYRRRDPQDLLLCVDLGGERYGMSAGVNAIDDLDFLLIDQPLHFIDRDVHLALTVCINRDHLVLAGDAAALVNKINRDLRAHRACRRATGSEWSRTGHRRTPIRTVSA